MQTFYTVRPNDTLYQIARRWEIPVESLIAANNISSPDTIYAGQQLSIPPGVDVVRVKSGDTVYSIAQAYRVPQSVIISANQLSPPYMIQVGQLLRVPAGVPYYIVQPGDTLYAIARRYNVETGSNFNYQLIQQVNQLPSIAIYPGMRLMIPFAPPGDSGLLAYTSNIGSGYDIWIYNPRTGTVQQVTSGLGESYSIPYWAPDSSRIAFVGRNGILTILNLADLTVAQIDQFAEGLGVFIDWSPNSEAIVYTKQNQMIIYNVITHQVMRINEPSATDVQWFPNGEELLYQSQDRAGVSQLFRIKADGTGKQQITENTGGPLNNVRLSPNGSYVLYTTPGASISLIHTINLTTGELNEVKGGPLAKNYFPEWSPNSATIAYSATAYEDRGYFSQVRVTNRQGENDRTLAISDCFATPVTWTPDSRKIAYLSGCNNQGVGSEIWLLDINHPVPIRLVAGGVITSLQWSPMSAAQTSKTYRNDIYKVQFQYPSNWQRVTEERYEGSDGFFQISAIAAGDAIDQVCENEAFHTLMPYGTNPRINKTSVQNQEACFIYPSADQPTEMRGQAALIVRYPSPVLIEGTTYNYFILWASEVHLAAISESLKFFS